MKIYFCETYYHLLVAILKNIKSKGENEIVINAEFTNNRLINDKKVIDNLQKTKIFKKIYFFDFSEKQVENRKSKFHFIKDLQLIKKIYKSKEYDFLQAREIYLFYDGGLISRYLNWCKIDYHLLEDGTDSFKNNSKQWQKESFFKRMIKEKVFGFYKMGQSPRIKTIEVNDKTGIDNLPEEKVIEFPKKKLFESISNDEKKEILNIFMPDFDSEEFKNSILLITQPFWIDGVLKTEQKQIEMYEDIIEKYAHNSKVIIKVHPRETTKYKQHFPNCYVIDKPFPVEILLFCKDLSVEKAITVSSTSVSSLDFAKERIFLGWDWLNEYKK